MDIKPPANQSRYFLSYNKRWNSSLLQVLRHCRCCRSWRSLTSDPLFAAAHASRHPHVVVVHRRFGSNNEEVEVRAVDLHGDVVKRRRIRIAPNALGRLSMHGDLLCAAHGWGLACVGDVVTGGAAADVRAEHWRKVNAMQPECVLGHVPSTGEHKVVRIQDAYGQRRQTCEVMTLGDGAGRWRRRPQPPVAVSIGPCGSRNVAVVAGLAYFLVCPPGPGSKQQPYVQADSIAVFDLMTEEWKPATLQGPLSSCSWPTMPYGPVLRKTRFQLAGLGESSLVVVYCNVEASSTELWFVEDMEDMHVGATLEQTVHVALQRTPFRENEPIVYCNLICFVSSLRYHYPLAVLDDGRILVWVERTSALRAYDPETSAMD